VAGAGAATHPRIAPAAAITAAAAAAAAGGGAGGATAATAATTATTGKRGNSIPTAVVLNTIGDGSCLLAAAMASIHAHMGPRETLSWDLEKGIAIALGQRMDDVSEAIAGLSLFDMFIDRYDGVPGTGAVLQKLRSKQSFNTAREESFAVKAHKDGDVKSAVVYLRDPAQALLRLVQASGVVLAMMSDRIIKKCPRLHENPFLDLESTNLNIVSDFQENLLKDPHMHAHLATLATMLPAAKLEALSKDLAKWSLVLKQRDDLERAASSGRNLSEICDKKEEEQRIKEHALQHVSEFLR